MGSGMHFLVVEDEFTSRKILTRLLGEYGEADVAVDGDEAKAAIKAQLSLGSPYEVIFLDIMLPGMDGQEVLRCLREAEAEHGVELGQGARVIMTTSLADAKNVMRAFRSGCESYLVKPIDKPKVVGELVKLGLIEAA